ncbi:MAG: hypothetical protein AAF514_10900, partial [Verrucomicrobiota bacterium]
GVLARMVSEEPYAYGDGQEGVYVRAPGPDRKKANVGFLSIGMAFSFFIFWAFGAAGQPANMVRFMAFKDTRTLRRSVMLVAVYYSAIYFLLVVIFCCGRLLLEGMETNPDRTMPTLAKLLTASAGFPWLAGLLLAAPFAAVMSSVDSFLLVVSSSLVRDVYQPLFRQDASEAQIKRVSYLVTAVIGIGAALAALRPPTYLQDMIIFASSGLAACFLVPVGFALYWSRMTARGALLGMMGGFLTHCLLYLVGYGINGEFTVHPLLGLQPFVWDLMGSTLGVLLGSLSSRPLDEAVVRRFFG